MTYDPSHPQHQSAFVTFLPREIRDRVYLELWRSCGLRQHIVWHRDKDDKAKSHFCPWRCITPFSVHDELQETIDATRLQLGFPLGDSFSNKAYALQLFSAWKNHFAPSECLKSIYESTSFIFTDIFALNMFIDFCEVPETWKEGVESQSSLCCCRTRRLRYHHCQKSVTRLDFHGLRLHLLENLMTLNIWVSARCTELLLDRNADNINQSPYNITQLDLGSLKEALSTLNHVRNVTLSMPLAQVSETEDGYVVEDAMRTYEYGEEVRVIDTIQPYHQSLKLNA
ncbi:hypothetical protein FOZG_10290 [Fusarium oxysporum Fo47]|uniref:Uncharacterized protein n=3 Tax=Fusarium oxysporum TaxID=5507 RepID=W9K9Z4_FUSOX|nr:hypothetical protein FOZG_10290 [Fusarium oxysporum Fo47]